jgi:hypothetical protein
VVPGRWVKGQRRALRPRARNEHFRVAVPVHFTFLPNVTDRACHTTSLYSQAIATLLARPLTSGAPCHFATPRYSLKTNCYYDIAVRLRATITFQTVFLPLVFFRFLSFVPLRLPYQSVYKPLSFPRHTCREGTISGTYHSVSSYPLP